MDQSALVEHQIDDVPKLIDQLKRDNFDVKAAFWLYTSEADQWFLYIVSDMVDQVGSAQAYRYALRSMRQLPGLWINPFEIKLIGSHEPIARAVTAFRANMHRPVPTQVRGANLDKIYIENAYIYPV
jgi:hypothetical protein